MSTAVATAPDAEHELLEGRPRVVYTSGSGSSSNDCTTTSTTTTTSNSNANQTPPNNNNNNSNNNVTVTPGKKLSNLFARVSSSVSSSRSSASPSPRPTTTTTTTSTESPAASTSHHDHHQHHPALMKRSITVPMDARLPDYLLHPPPLRMEHWSEPPARSFAVRGPHYTRDRLKQPSQDALFTLLTVDVVQVEGQPLPHGLCQHPTERIQRALQREREAVAAGQPLPKEELLPAFVFCVNYIVPGGTVSCSSSSTGSSGSSNEADATTTTTTTPTFFHWAAYFGTDHVAALRDTTTPLGRLTEPFFFGPMPDEPMDAVRHQAFKLIPRIVQGNFMIRKAVGSKPALLGRKLQLSYRRDETNTLPRFFEVMVDIGSDPVADRIVKLALGGAKSLVVDMMFLLEGTDDTVLPERILGGARMEYLDFKNPALSRKIAHSTMTSTAPAATTTTSDEQQQEQ